MKIDYVIPTHNRKEKCIKCVASIVDALTYVSEMSNFIYIYTNSKEEYSYYQDCFQSFPRILVHLLSVPYNAPTFWNTHLKNTNADIMFYLNDDVVLNPICVNNAINSMITHFPDNDGIVGLYQENIPENQVVKTAFGAIGSTFAERFPDKQVFCPEYKRFYLDKELETYSSHIGKLYWDKDAKLIHLHPSFSQYQADRTHNDVRKHLQEDKKLYSKRQELNLLWGDSFELFTSLSHKK